MEQTEDTLKRFEIYDAIHDVDCLLVLKRLPDVNGKNHYHIRLNKVGSMSRFLFSTMSISEAKEKFFYYSGYFTAKSETGDI